MEIHYLSRMLIYLWHNGSIFVIPFSDQRLAFSLLCSISGWAIWQRLFNIFFLSICVWYLSLSCVFRRLAFSIEFIKICSLLTEKRWWWCHYNEIEWRINTKYIHATTIWIAWDIRSLENLINLMAYAEQNREMKKGWWKLYFLCIFSQLVNFIILEM